MKVWNTTFLVLSILITLMSFLPAFNFKHWLFRVFDYVRLQVLFLIIALLILGGTTLNNISNYEIGAIILLVLSITHQLLIVSPYVSIQKNKFTPSSTNSFRLVSANVLQSNKEYQKLINLANEVKPDILITMESNKAWGKALSKIEDEFCFVKKVPKENKYGIHFYSKLKVKECKVHYLISDEYPSIEAIVTDTENNDFVIWAIHPPPPSPTEKPTSKQKDAELMAVAKKVRAGTLPTIVVGDFNNPCWSKSSKLFSKVSKLKDARLKRGFYSTFPVKPWILRFPIDLLFHSESVDIHKIKILTPIGSDHLPLLSIFSVNSGIPSNEINQKLPQTLKEKTNVIIKEGKKASIEENED